MEFSKEQLSTLSNRFTREKIQQAMQQSRAKKPRIHKLYYERADIAALISESTIINKATKRSFVKKLCWYLQ